MSIRTHLLVALCILPIFFNRATGVRIETRDRVDLSGIPPCGLTCLSSAATTSNCPLSVLTCVCRNRVLAKIHSDCMLAKCTMQDTLDTARVQAKTCNWSQESKANEFNISTAVIYTSAFLFVALRIAGKLVSSRLAWDDAVVVAALCLTAVPLGCVLAMTQIGFGEHLWNLKDGKLLPILRLFAIAWSTYTVVLGLIKISLLMFYLEIFQSRGFRNTAYSILVFIILNTTVICLLTTFACTPVQSFWNRDLHGKCMNVTALALANSASAIIQDIILLVLPLFFIKDLNMQRNRKIAVAFMFCVGSFGCIATIIRLRILIGFKLSIDPTWDYVAVTVWTELELAAIFLCVSLPSIRILIVRLLPRGVKKWFSSITRSSKNSSDPIRNPQLQVDQNPQNAWRKPSSWEVADVPMRAGEKPHDTKTWRNYLPGLLTSNPLWSRVQGSGFSSYAGRSHRLPSIASDINHTNITTSQSTYKKPRNSMEEHISIELKDVPTSMAASGHRGFEVEGAGEITALASIGCLPERTFSHIAPSKS